MGTRASTLSRMSLLSIVILSGCALTTAQVNLAYLPEAQKRSPLAAIPPMMIALEVEDQRPITEQARVGSKKNNLGQVTADVISTKEVTGVIYDALKVELQNNGHRVTDKKGDDVAVVVKTRLRKYWSDLSVGFWAIEMIGTVSAEIAILSNQTKTVAVTKTINSTFRESRQIATDGAFESVLNGALVEFIRSFSRDPTILEALRLAQQGGQKG